MEMEFISEPFGENFMIKDSAFIPFNSPISMLGPEGLGTDMMVDVCLDRVLDFCEI